MFLDISGFLSALMFVVKHWTCRKIWHVFSHTLLFLYLRMSTRPFSTKLTI